MKTYLKYLLLILSIILFFKTDTYSQKSDESNVKIAMTNLMEFSKSKTYEKASTLILYSGEDKTRIQKDSFNPSSKEELNQVKRICKKISALMELSSNHEFGEYSVSNLNGAETFSVEVSFISGDQKLVTTFSFIKSGNKFLLSNMN